MKWTDVDYISLPAAEGSAAHAHAEGLHPFVSKVAPEGSLQGFQIPYIGGLINMEPRTLWGKLLLKEREEYAFSEPQVRTCMGQQPGALSSKEACSRCWQQTLAQRQHSNVASEWIIPRGSPPSTRWPSLKTSCSSATWAAQNRASPRGQKRVLTQTLQEMTSRSQPLQNRLKMSAVPHQHNLGDINVALVITIMYLIRWQNNMLPARLLQGHKLMAPCSYRCL